MEPDPPSPIPARLRPLIWSAYDAFEKRNAEAAFVRLRADESARSWSDAELRQSIEIVEQLWSVGQGLYDEGYIAGDSGARELAARFPGVPFELCDALMGYLGATQH